MNYDWDFRPLQPYLPDFARATLTTLELGIGATLFGSLIGFPLGLVFSKASRWSPGIIANDALKSLPALFLILFFNYFPWKALLGVRSPGPFVVALLALTLSQIVFTADLVRGAILNADRGPIAAARALGVPSGAIWTHIILPDVMRQITPTLSAYGVGNLKLASLASVIGVEELMFVARVAAGQQFRMLEAFTVVAAIYLIVITPLTAAVRVFESRAKS